MRRSFGSKSSVVGTLFCRRGVFPSFPGTDEGAEREDRKERKGFALAGDGAVGLNMELLCV